MVLVALIVASVVKDALEHYLDEEYEEEEEECQRSAGHGGDGPISQYSPRLCQRRLFFSSSFFRHFGGESISGHD